MVATSIRLEGIDFAIGRFRMRGVSLDVADGEYFVLTGPNGSGKTLLLKLVAALLSPDSGETMISGRPMRDVPPWRRNIGYAPQESTLFQFRTVADNIGFGLEVRGVRRKQRRARVAEIAERLGVSHLLDRLPEGLSGGEQQRVSIARALAPRPGILLFDEPVSAIDGDARDPLCVELKKLQKELGSTTIHVAHNERETELVADRVGAMRDGRIVACRPAAPPG